MAIVTKNSMLAFYKKLRRDCKRDLKTLQKGTKVYEVVEGNLMKAETWIAFLSDPDVPELDDPKFKSKMKKLDAKAKAAK